MTDHQLKLILRLLPPDQHQSASQRIRSSESFGWTDVRLFRIAGQTGFSHELDLIGETPNGETRFLPE